MKKKPQGNGIFLGVVDDEVPTTPEYQPRNNPLTLSSNDEEVFYIEDAVYRPMLPNLVTSFSTPTFTLLPREDTLLITNSPPARPLTSIEMSGIEDLVGKTMVVIKGIPKPSSYIYYFDQKQPKEKKNWLGENPWKTIWNWPRLLWIDASDNRIYSV